MGTNYYLHRNVCQCCKRSDEPLHIGKSSYGWCFHLHVMPDDNIRDIDDWEREWLNGEIRDEYGQTVTIDEMRAVIMLRTAAAPFDKHSWTGYKNEEDFHRQNYSERGPNGLIRSKIDGSHCIGHGIGPWDLTVGEFS